MSSDACEEVAPSNEQIADKQPQLGLNDKIIAIVRLALPRIASMSGAHALLLILAACYSYPAELYLKSSDFLADFENLSNECSNQGRIVEDFYSDSTRCSAFMDDILQKEIDFKQKIQNVTKGRKWVSLAYRHLAYFPDTGIKRCTTSMRIPEHERENFVTYKLEELKWRCRAAGEHCCDSGCCEKDFALRVKEERLNFIDDFYFYFCIAVLAYMFSFVLKWNDNKRFEQKLIMDKYEEDLNKWELEEEEERESKCDSIEEWDDEAIKVIEAIDKFDESDCVSEINTNECALEQAKASEEVPLSNEQNSDPMPTTVKNCLLWISSKDREITRFLRLCTISMGCVTGAFALIALLCAFFGPPAELLRNNKYQRTVYDDFFWQSICSVASFVLAAFVEYSHKDKAEDRKRMAALEDRKRKFEEKMQEKHELTREMIENQGDDAINAIEVIDKFDESDIDDEL